MLFFNKNAQFEKLIKPHLDSAYNLTRYLARNDADAEDILQEALLRAFRFFDAGRDLRPWFLQIVRNCTYSWLKRRNRYLELSDEQLHLLPDPEPIAETQWLNEVTALRIREVLLQLAPQFQEILILREIEQMPYHEIAIVTGLPEGTVRSRLSRARQKFREVYSMRDQGN